MKYENTFKAIDQILWKEQETDSHEYKIGEILVSLETNNIKTSI